METSSHPQENQYPKFDIIFDFYRNILMSTELKYMEKSISNETCHSGNMEDLSTSKKEREIARILTAKFHIEPTTDSK
jgi:hypothetical protein